LQVLCGTLLLCLLLCGTPLFCLLLRILLLDIGIA
jgi:hypothetical protein